MLSFPVIFAGTMTVMVVLDALNIMHPTKHFYQNLPEGDFSSLLLSHNGTSTNTMFLLQGMALVPVLHVWRTIVKRVASLLARPFANLHGDKSASKHVASEHEKFCEQAWLFVHYSMVTVLEYEILKTKPFWPPLMGQEQRRAMFVPTSVALADQDEFGFWLFYQVQFAFYALELTTLLFMWKHGRKDKYVYLLHHLFTVFLVGISWVRGLHRIGSVVLFLHDIGDVFLPLGKCFSYAEPYAKTQSPLYRFAVEKLGLMFFVFFVILFVIPRLVFYGAVVYSGIYDSNWCSCVFPVEFDPSASMDECVTEAIAGLGWNALLVGTLSLLYTMHVFWTMLIGIMANRLLFGEFKDVRSDDEGEESMKKHE